MFVSDKFPTYELDSTKVDAHFLSWYFKYPPLWEQARKKSVGSAAVSKLTLNPPRFMHLTIPLPKLPEQQRIAGKIRRLSMSVHEAKILRMRAKREAGLLLSTVLGSLATGFGELGRLGDVLLDRPRNGWSARCDNADDGVPVLTLGAITGYRYQSANHKKTSLATDPTARYWLKAGDLLVTRSNTPELVGHAAIYDGRPHPCIYPDLMMRVAVDVTRADTRFAWYWLQTPIVRGYVGKKSKGTSPTMKKIGQRTVMEIPFPTGLSLSEQRIVVQRLDALQAKLDVLMTLQSETVDRLGALPRSVLDKAFTGEL